MNNIKIYNEYQSDINSLHERLSLYPLNWGFNTLIKKDPILYNDFQVFANKINLDIKSIRKFILKAIEYYNSDIYQVYSNLKSKEDVSKLFRAFQKSSGLFSSQKESFIKETYPNIFNYCCQEENESWKAFAYRITKDIYEAPKCKYCGNPAHFIDIANGFSDTCNSKECRSKNKSEIWNNKTPEEKALKTERFKQTSIKKYGVDNPNKCRAVREKLEQTCLERYGVKYSTQAEQAKKKKIETFIRNYGVNNPNKVESIKQKVRKTCLERYGVENPNQSLKAKQSTLERYGVENYNWLHMPKGTPEIISNKDKLKQFMIDHSYQTVIEMSKILGISSYSLMGKIHQFELDEYIPHINASFPEREIGKIIESFYNGSIIYNTRSIISPYELDIYLPEKNIAIEFNGNYWHRYEKLEEDKGLGYGKTYHQLKSFKCKEKGIQLIHIFEYEWSNEFLKDKLIDYLKYIIIGSSNKIYARNCIIREVSSKDSNEFLNENHLQGQDNAPIRLGLYLNDELVSLMTFNKPRFNKNYEYELSRFVNKNDYSVIGGASKLLKYFEDNYNPKSLISYCNISKMKGTLYEKLGFTLTTIARPNYVWVSGLDILSRYQCQKHKLIKQGYEGISENDIMTKRGYSKIYDCGNYVITKNYSP